LLHVLDHFRRQHVSEKEGDRIAALVSRKQFSVYCTSLYLAG
jgi:hypothetical protein